jgi:hypothetical protein
MQSTRGVVGFGGALLVVVLWFAAGGFAQPESPSAVEQQVTRRVEDFLRQIAAGDVDIGLKTLLASSPLARDGERIDRLKTSLPQTLQRYGTFIRTEKLRIERVGDSLVRCTWLYHASAYPVVWRITFYRGDSSATGEWTVIGLEFDTDYQRLPPAGESRTP